MTDEYIEIFGYKNRIMKELITYTGIDSEMIEGLQPGALIEAIPHEPIKEYGFVIDVSPIDENGIKLYMIYWRGVQAWCESDEPLEVGQTVEIEVEQP
jgi:hypothetical protein